MLGRGLLGVPGVVDSAVLPDPTDEVRVTQFTIQVCCPEGDPVPDPVADPDGDGDPGTGTNPTNGDSICGVPEPVTWCEIELPDGTTVKRYAKLPINVGDPKEPRALSWGSIRRSLSGAFGDNRGATMSPTLIDTDGTLRAAEDSDSLVGCRYTQYVSSKTQLKADPTHRVRVFDGVITDTEPQAQRTFSLQVTDYLSTLLDEFNKRTYPQRVFNTDDFPNMGNAADDPTSPGNPTMVGKPVPIGYGLLSDESGADPVGVVPCVYTGKRAIAYYDGALWDEYVFFGHAAAAIQSLFIPQGPGLSTGTTYPSRVRITAAAPAVEYLFPGTAAWTAAFGSAPYRDFHGNRYTVVYAFGPRSEINRTGQVPLVANMGGIEDVGDGSGLLIDDLYRQIQHLLVNWIFGNYTSGSWLSIPSVGSGADLYSRIDTDTIEAVRTLRASGSPSLSVLGAFLLGYNGTALTLDQILTMAAKNGHFEYGVNQHGQIIFDALDAGRTLNRDLTALADTLQQTYHAKRQRDLVRNVITYRSGRRYSPPLAGYTPAEDALLPVSTTQQNADWLSGDLRLEDAASLAKYGERREDIDFAMIRDETTATAIAQITLDEQASGEVRVSFEEGPCGVDTDLGDRDTLTHFDALSNSARSLRCMAHALDLDSFKVTKEYREL